jgi:hypothetical protein
LKTLSLLGYQFYRLLFYFNIACTLLAIAVVWYGMGYMGQVALLLSKIFGFAGAVSLYHYFEKDTYYYFRNAGCRLRHIIPIAFFIDITLLAGSFLLVNLITHATTYFKN